MQFSTELHMLVSIQRQASLANKTERPCSIHSSAHCGYVWFAVVLVYTLAGDQPCCVVQLCSHVTVLMPNS